MVLVFPLDGVFVRYTAVSSGGVVASCALDQQHSDGCLRQRYIVLALQYFSLIHSGVVLLSCGRVFFLLPFSDSYPCCFGVRESKQQPGDIDEWWMYSGCAPRSPTSQGAATSASLAKGTSDRESVTAVIGSQTAVCACQR